MDKYEFYDKYVEKHAKQLDYFFVGDPKELAICQEMVEASSIKPKGYEQLRELPIEAIKRILSIRYRKTVSNLRLCDGYAVEDNLLENLITDIDLISFLVANGFDLYEEDFNKEIILGKPEDLTDIVGILDSYIGALTKGRVNPTLKRDFGSGEMEVLINPNTGKPYRAIEYIEYVKGIAIEQKELSNGKSR